MARTQRTTKGEIIEMIQGRLEQKEKRVVGEQEYVTQQQHVYFKNSANLKPIPLKSLPVNTLIDILDKLLSYDKTDIE